MTKEKAIVTNSYSAYSQATVLCNARFDSDTKFPIYGSDEKGERVKVGEQNRLEFKEMFTLGFAYKFY
jgi:hypothetical protein